jgi:hypothetical protein
MLANVSGREVPMATNVIALTDGSIPSTHPTSPATLPTTPVRIPIKAKATMKEGHPPPYLVGGTRANRIFQKMVAKCITACYPVTYSTMRLSSSMVGPSITAFLNCCL